ncbi:HNH endonuclease [Luteibacter sp. NPDC031894]|uniref:HNH endonuclease n=1 Tax=Luteibacter sp. NPDC031894 TaxID=3390572 RepID=UPI003CFF0899
MDWFRLYAEFSTDPKVQMMSEAMQRRLVMLFCLRTAGIIPTTDDAEVAFALRVSEEDLAKTKELFVSKGFIDEIWDLMNWDKRQFSSDSSNERVKKYREKRKAMGLTSNGYTKHIETVMVRDGGCCVYCGSDKNLCIDHAYPVARGGNDDIENLVAACKSCNSGKAGRTPYEAGMSFLNKRTEAIWNHWIKCNGFSNALEQIQNRTDTEQKEQKLSARHDSRAKPVDESPVVISIPLNDSTEFPITERQVAEFEGLYPAVDVRQEFRGMRAWSLSNPTKRKTRSGALKFANAWLSKAQNEAPQPSQRGSPPRGPTSKTGEAVMKLQGVINGNQLDRNRDRQGLAGPVVLELGSPAGA